MESGKHHLQPQYEEISCRQLIIITPQNLQSLELARPLSNAYLVYLVSKSFPLLQQSNFEKYSSVLLTFYSFSPVFYVCVRFIISAFKFICFFPSVFLRAFLLATCFPESVLPMRF